jgi:hypothetical protein
MAYMDVPLSKIHNANGQHTRKVRGQDSRMHEL